MYYVGVLGAPRQKVVLVASAVDTVNRINSYTFSGLDFGEDFPGRTLVAMVHLANSISGAIDQIACTIGGVSASGGDAGDSNDGPPTGGAGSGIWSAQPSGASGTVAVAFQNTSANACAIYLYAVADLASGSAAFTSTGPGGAGGITSDPTYPASMSGSLNVPSGGNAVIFGAVTRAGSTSSISLVGITRTYDVTLDGVHRIAGGFDIGLPQQTGRTVGLSTATSNVIFGMRAASFS